MQRRETRSLRRRREIDCALCRRTTCALQFGPHARIRITIITVKTAVVSLLAVVNSDALPTHTYVVYLHCESPPTNAFSKYIHREQIISTALSPDRETHSMVIYTRTDNNNTESNKNYVYAYVYNNIIYNSTYTLTWTKSLDHII